ncbi:MAG: hypothetical protein ACLPPF_12265 [Rhodomicrobium sp.]
MWDEVCVQVQGQESVMWDVYLDTISGIIAGYLSGLDDAVKQAIWLQTNNGMDWEPSEEEKDTPSSEEDIADYILTD